jgi:hypothetical protein
LSLHAGEQNWRTDAED